MALKQYNPTSPGRRFMTTLDFATSRRRGRSSASPSRSRRPAAATAKGRITIWFRGGGHKRALSRRSTSGATSATSRPRWRRSSTTRTARRASRCCTTPTARSATSSRPDGLKVGQTVVAGDGADILPGNALPLQDDPRRHHDPQHRAAAGQGRPARAQRRRRGAARGEGGRVRPGASCPPARCARCTPTACATIGQVGNLDHKNVSFGKAGRQPLAGAAARTTAASSMNPVDHPHGGGEGRTSRRPPPGDPVGQAHQGRQDPEQQADRSGSS